MYSRAPRARTSSILDTNLSIKELSGATTTTRSEKDQRFYLMEEISRMGEIEAKANGNWKFVPENWVKPAAERDYQLLFGKKK